MKKITIYTDGACSGNPGPGGWGAVLMYGTLEREMSGHDPATTNNRMEMLGAIRALQSLKEPCQVTLVTDSKYLLQGITEWVKGWQARGWKTADKKPVKNVDLWLELMEAVKPHKIDWKWVKGHANDPINHRVDALAVAAIRR
jgi:ribonuclease HI